MAQVLCHLNDDKKYADPNLIVGFDTSDDAGVYRISDDVALIQTLDFFTPVVDDPYIFGQIAAANALSDVYAMGGKPLTAMNIACFACSLDAKILADILRGGADKVQESGTALVGGHTVTDNEVKYGLSVTGVIHPSKVITNSGAKPGDVLILTKPLGSGVITTAFKFDMIDEHGLQEAIHVMSTLNKAASQAMQRIGVNGCTDVTGFGLLGHAYEMANGSKLAIKIFSSKVPLMRQVTELIKQEAVPGGAYSNYAFVEKWITFSQNVSQQERIALCDPQTSGGLLISVPREKADPLLKELHNRGVKWSTIIGEVTTKDNVDNVITVV